jgi:uncharacterized protein YebE (UPF0316 family)
MKAGDRDGLKGITMSFGSASWAMPLLVFVAEMLVITVGTVRIIAVSRGWKYLAPVLGFFEVTIWLFAIGQIMSNLSNFSLSLAYASGFTMGNYLGVLIDEKLALGSLVVRVITPRDPAMLTEGLRGLGYGATLVQGQGATGPVQVILSVIRRRDLDRVLVVVKGFDPKVFYSIEDLQTAAAGITPLQRPRTLLRAA